MEDLSGPFRLDKEPHLKGSKRSEELVPKVFMLYWMLIFQIHLPFNSIAGSCVVQLSLSTLKDRAGLDRP